MAHPLPPIAQLARRIVRDVDIAVRRFSRYNKYSVGVDLRTRAMAVTLCVHHAWRDRRQQLARVRELVLAIDALKCTMQLGKDVEAFGSFGEFEALARLVHDLGRQGGGWLKALHGRGQNGQAARPPDQRAIDTEFSSRLAKATP